MSISKKSRNYVRIKKRIANCFINSMIPLRKCLINFYDIKGFKNYFKFSLLEVLYHNIQKYNIILQLKMRLYYIKSS